MSFCAWSKYSELPSNPEGYPGDAVARYQDLGESQDLPDGFARVTTVEAFEAHANTVRQQLDDFLTLRDWRLFNAPLAIKAEAQRRIFALINFNLADPVAGIIRQMNLTTNCVRIIARKSLHGIDPSLEELALVDAGISLVEKVNAIRSYSNELEARAATGEVFDVALQNWPY